RALGIGKRQHGFAEALLRRLMRDACLDETLGPIAERARRNAERGFLRFAHAEAAFDRVLPGKEGQHRPGPAGLVAVIKVIGAGVVKLARALAEPQAERAGVEVEVSHRLAGNGRDVVQACHGGVLLPVAGFESKTKLVRPKSKTILTRCSLFVLVDT